MNKASSPSNKVLNTLGALAMVAGLAFVVGLSRQMGPSYAGVPEWITRPALK